MADEFSPGRDSAGRDSAARGSGRAAAPAAPDEPSPLLPTLTRVQAERRHLAGAQIHAAAVSAGVGDAAAFGVASFYALLSTRSQSRPTVRICDGPACRLAADDEAATVAARARAEGWNVQRTSCLGLCDCAPAVLLDEHAAGKFRLAGGQQCFDANPAEPPGYVRPQVGETRLVMSRVGHIDPECLSSARQAGAYEALARALAAPPRQVLLEVERAGLAGRGGAGFPTARKWQAVADSGAPVRYVVCNADESEPGVFKDRVLLAQDPHLVLEGLALAAYAVGAAEGIVYVRGEYELFAQRLERAVAAAAQAGWLGTNIQGSGFSLRVHVHRGAGAYICGEETALLESLEGRRGEPRVRPPFPTQIGYRGCPTVVNNVETLCCVPSIVALGAERFRAHGTPANSGTRLFCLSGHVRTPCVVEVPPGITLRELIDRFGGGMRGPAPLKFAMFGAAGRVVPAALCDVPLDDSAAARERGITLGSAGIIVADQSTPAPAALWWLLTFFEAESCGKCTPCRVGARQARIIAQRLADGRGRAGDVAELRRLARMLDQTSMCGLGRSIAWPIDSLLEYFAEEFVA